MKRKIYRKIVFMRSKEMLAKNVVDDDDRIYIYIYV